MSVALLPLRFVNRHGSSVAVFLHNPSNGFEQFFRIHGFLKKVAGAFPNGVYRHLDVAVPRKENDWQGILAAIHLVLQFQSRYAGHADIENQASRT